MSKDVIPTIDFGVLVTNEERFCDAAYIEEIIEKAARRQCVFRSKVTTHFGPKLPLISEQSYHLFRSESFHFLCRCRNGW